MVGPLPAGERAAERFGVKLDYPPQYARARHDLRWIGDGPRSRTIRVCDGVM